MSDERTRKGPVEILLVEDNPGDVRLTQLALEENRVESRLNVASDGVEALAYLRCEGRYSKARRPDLILLDLNLPKKDGRQVLAEIKQDDRLKTIPVVVLSISRAEDDVIGTYKRSGNCYISKPVDLDRFARVVRSIQDFWFTVATLPPKGTS